MTDVVVVIDSTAKNESECEIASILTVNDMKEILLGDSNNTFVNQTTKGVTEMPFCAQVSSWDCGVACLIMTYQWMVGDTEKKHHKDLSTTRNAILRSIGTQSIWTVDLAVSVHELLVWSSANTNQAAASSSSDNMGVILMCVCSRNFQVDASYKELQFYRDGFTEDQRRVRQKFRIMRKHKIPTVLLSQGKGTDEEDRLSMELLLDILSYQHCIAIALVNSQLLVAESSQQPTKTPNFIGHYVVLCGVSEESRHLQQAQRLQGSFIQSNKCLVVKNPSSVRSVEYWSPSQFEAAWRSHGTDEDIIFLSKQIKPSSIRKERDIKRVIDCDK